MDIDFPIEFVVRGTPVSLQSRNATAKNEWKARVFEACREQVDAACFATTDHVTVIIYYFASEESQGDIDNYVKLIIDALVPHIVSDDEQVESVIARRFRPNMINWISDPSTSLVNALKIPPPAVYVSVHNEPYRGLKK